MRMFWCVVGIVAMAAGGGCADRRAYQVVVTNRLPAPITIGLVKDGPPYEPQWGTIEQWSRGGASPSAMPPWGMVVPPGRTADSGRVEGQFERGAGAYLRVYRGERSNAELLAVGGTSPDRVTVPLEPGVNELEVVEEGLTSLIVRRVR